MKSIIKSLTAATMLAMIFAGCHREHPGFDNGGDPSIDGQVGYISFAGCGLSVEWSGENVNAPANGKSRAADPDTGDWNITIVRTAPEYGEVKSGTLDEFQTAPVALPFTHNDEPAYYQVFASSGTMKDVAWDDEAGHPTYSGKTNAFPMSLEYNSPENAYEVGEIHCTLESIKVSVSLENSLANAVSQASFDVKIYKNTETVEEAPYFIHYGAAKPHNYGVVNMTSEYKYSSTVTDPAFGYLKPVADGNGNAISVYVDMIYNNTPIAQHIEITDSASANEYRNIMLYIKESEKPDDPDDPTTPTGTIIIGATVETWTWGKNVDVDFSEQAFLKNGEPTIEEQGGDNPNAPEIGSASFNFKGVNKFSVADYDDAGNFTGDASISIAGKDGRSITGFTVQLATDNEEYVSEIMSIYGLASGDAVNLADKSTGNRVKNSFFASYGFPTSIAGSELNFDIAGFFEDIYNYGGNYTYTFTVTDSSNYTATMDLKIAYDATVASDGPTIVWDGHDLNDTHEVSKTKGLDVVLKISAPNGIQHMYIKMLGGIRAVMDETGLLSSPDFDLVDPNPDDEFTLSDTCGFPIRDQVENKEFLEFPLTDFMIPLAALTKDKGDSQFELTIVDNKDLQTTATLKLTIVD